VFDLGEETLGPGSSLENLSFGVSLRSTMLYRRLLNCCDANLLTSKLSAVSTCDTAKFLLPVETRTTQKLQFPIAVYFFVVFSEQNAMQEFDE
jgi:hypothetical protein